MKKKVEKKENKPVIEQKDFSAYSWVVLAILIVIRISHQMNTQSLGYVFGFLGDGVNAGSTFYEIRSAFPQLFANYGLLSGPAFSVSFSFAGLFMGMLL